MSDQIITPEMLFVVAAQGDGCHSILASGREELRTAVCACLWMGHEQNAPPDVVEILETLDDPDEWSGQLPFFAWARAFEDGSISVQRVLAAHTAEVERRRKVETALRDMLAAVDTVAGRCGLPAELFQPRAHAREVLRDA